MKAIREIHGYATTEKRSPEYMAWLGIKKRCKNPRHKNYRNYGARGIKVCAEWDESFIAFLKHIGPRPSPKHSVDRIDVNGNYEPGNVRWATREIQNGNKRTSIQVTVNGISKHPRGWERELGLPFGLVNSRVRAGWPLERLFLPPGSKRHEEQPK